MFYWAAHAHFFLLSVFALSPIPFVSLCVSISLFHSIISPNMNLYTVFCCCCCCCYYLSASAWCCFFCRVSVSSTPKRTRCLMCMFMFIHFCVFLFVLCTYIIFVCCISNQLKLAKKHSRHRNTTKSIFCVWCWSETTCHIATKFDECLSITDDWLMIIRNSILYIIFLGRS